MEKGKEQTMGEMATHRVASKVDPTVHKYVLAHLWSGSFSSGTKVAVFVRGRHKETGEEKWMLHPSKPVIFAPQELLDRPDVAFLLGDGAKQFLLQQGYKVNQKNKLPVKIQENKLNRQLNEMKSLMTESGGLLGGSTELIRKLFNLRSIEEKKAEVLQYIKSGKHPYMLKAYEQYMREDPTGQKADKYVEFYAQNPNNYPKWNGQDFVPTGDIQWLGEEEPIREEVNRWKQLM